MTQTVHLLVFDTLADWEIGYATARINDPAFQREPGACAVRTVSLGGRPVTTTGGLRIQPDGALEVVSPAEADVVADGDLITAPGTAPLEFARAIFARLDLYPPAVLDAWYGLFSTRRPENLAAPVAAAGA